MKPKFRYLAIYQEMKEKIENGEFQQGEKLKTEKEYQDEYGVSRDTIRKAFSKLENENYIVKKAAVGTFVKYKKSNYTLSRLESFTEQMHKRGIKPSSEFVSMELKTLDDQHILTELQIDKEEMCYKIVRIRKGDGAPMAYEIVYVAQKLCPDINKYLDNESSLYEIYENEYHYQLKSGKIRLDAEMPSTKIQKGLQIGHDSPVLKMQCTTMLEDGQPIYYVECYYIGEKYFFSALLPR